MRATRVLILTGILLVAACAPTTDVPNPTETPIAALEKTQPPAGSVETEPPATPTETHPPATLTETEPPAAPTETQSPAVLGGAALLQARCASCHNLNRVTNARKTSEEWRSTVNRMVGYGTVLSAAELEVLVQYLVVTYPK